MRYLFKGQFIAFLLLLLCSCSDTKHLSAVPSSCTALVVADVSRMSGVNSRTLLKAMLHVSDVDRCGLDLSEKICLFEMPDGTLGFCLSVEDRDDLVSFFGELFQKGICRELTKKRDCQLTIVGDTWAVGFSDRAMLVLGPVTVSAQAETFQKLVRYLKQDEEKSILNSRLYDTLQAIDAPMAMVAQAQVLPEQLFAPFTLGVPEDADPAQVYISAQMTVEDGILEMEGESFSYNKRVDQALKKSAHSFRPVEDIYVKQMPANSVYGLFMNIEGNDLLQMLHANRGLQALLMGVNAAIDMDKIIRSIDGNVALMAPMPEIGNAPMSMRAELKDFSFLNDIDYWKHSCPQGTKIQDHGEKQWTYMGNDMNFVFGVRGKEFFAGKEQFFSPGIETSRQLPDQVIRLAEGKRMCAILNLSAWMSSDGDHRIAEMLAKMSYPLFGHLDMVVFNLK